jgi:hypothetical protein
MLGGRVTAVAAQLADDRGTRTLIVVPYPDPGSARAAFRRLVSTLDAAITPLARAEDRLVFRDYDGSFGEASLSEARLEITLRLCVRPPG